jgi:hypothetical protein
VYIDEFTGIIFWNSGIKEKTIAFRKESLKCMAIQKGRRTVGKPRIRRTDQQRYIGKQANTLKLMMMHKTMSLTYRILKHLEY